MITRTKKIHKQGASYVVCLPIDWMRMHKLEGDTEAKIEMGYNEKDQIVIKPTEEKAEQNAKEELTF